MSSCYDILAAAKEEAFKDFSHFDEAAISIVSIVLILFLYFFLFRSLTLHITFYVTYD